jgi:hypothetical protein
MQAAFLLTWLLAQTQAPKVELVEPVAKIWDQGPHNAFTDLMRHDGRWLCVFREGKGHAAGAGTIRVLASADGKRWESTALLEDKDIDLRDPHLALAPDGRLMIVGGAAVPPTRDPVRDHYTFASFSKDAKTWTAPERISASWDWLWRVTWHKGKAYGVAYGSGPKESRVYRAALHASDDGRKFAKLTDFDIKQPTEATIRFDGDDMICLQRRDGMPNTAMLGRSKPPYKTWQWKDLGMYFGGPNFLRGPDSRWWATGRLLDKGKAQTVVGILDVAAGKLEPLLTLPSGGDTSYAGMVWHDDQLWISYYSSHEMKTCIYLAKVRVVK